MKIEGYAKEFADFFSLFAEYSAGAKKAPHKTDLKAELTFRDMFPSDRKYPPNYDEGYPTTCEDETH